MLLDVCYSFLRLGLPSLITRCSVFLVLILPGPASPFYTLHAPYMLLTFHFPPPRPVWASDSSLAPSCFTRSVLTSPFPRAACGEVIDSLDFQALGLSS